MKSTKIFSLIILVCSVLQVSLACAQDLKSTDSIQVKELLVMDTLNLDMNGPSNDVVFYMNGLVFLSNSKFHQEMIPDHITFGQVTSFFAPLEYISLESSRPLFSNDPFPYSPSGTSYSRDYQKVYFTKTVEISGKRTPEKIFEMDIVEGKASDYNQLSFTAGSTRYMHPAISTDGEFMILSSDLFPSSGGLDLFIVRKGVSGWTIPVNLGPDINTSGHEWFPFLDQHNNLFFSSSGHMGYGGYDLYVCFFNGNGWDKPQNMTDLVNTSKDEIGFSIHPGRKMAIYSTASDEEGQTGEVLKLRLDNNAYILAGIDPKNQDISLLLKDMIRTGYTSARFGAASKLEVQAGFSLTSLPLLSEDKPEPEPEPEVKPAIVVPAVEPLRKPEPVPEPILIVKEPEPEQSAETIHEPEKAPEQQLDRGPDPDRIVFRVQILSNAKANTQKSVTISGSTYSTWEYQYKGAYRITVGEFSSVQEASAFTKKCRSSGFSQAFVAAFRGNERETDPAVFK
ncbi:MAG: hypothetical protein V2B15_09850 [Bacteroidota bacterium]